MATIKEVANRAGVSTATVSRVLNRNYPVSKAAYEKVMQAVAEVDYRPNIIAKSLKTNKTYMIGLVVPDISNPYFMSIAKGVENVISPHGYTLTMCSTDEDQNKELRILNALNDKRLDYVILASSLTESRELNRLIQKGLKIIMVDTMVDDLAVDFVVENNRQASAELVEYALRLGHQKVGIVNGIAGISTAMERFLGYQDALRKYGISYQAKYTVSGGYYRDIAYRKVKQMLYQNQKDLPTLIYATNNQMAEGTMIAVKETGLKIPDDISLLSFGEIVLPELIEPKLTVINQNSELMGTKVGEVLIRRLEAGSCPHKKKIYTTPSSLMIRDSVRAL